MTVEIKIGDCCDVLKMMVEKSAHCVVTSPPYFGLRDYGVAGQIGLEETPAEYVEKLVMVFREVHRVLRDDGTLWLNLGDSYAGSWGAQGREGPQSKNRYNASQMSRNQIKNHPKRARFTGSIKESGIKPKDLYGIPWRVAFALQADGWYLRQDIIWHKPNPMPESVDDRCTKSHEYIFLLTKSERYYFDSTSIAEESVYQPTGTVGAIDKPRRSSRLKSELSRDRKRAGAKGNAASFRAVRETRNKRSVWTVSTQPYQDAHFATFPPGLIEPCVLAGCPSNGTVLDPFGGAGTTGLVADRNGRDAVLIELNPEYAAMARRRIYGDAPLFAEVK